MKRGVRYLPQLRQITILHGNKLVAITKSGLLYQTNVNGTEKCDKLHVQMRYESDFVDQHVLNAGCVRKGNKNRLPDRFVHVELNTRGLSKRFMPNYYLLWPINPLER